MGLLNKALIYRNNYLNKLESKSESGLLKKAINYLERTDNYESYLKIEDDKHNFEAPVLEDSFNLAKYYDDENLIETETAEEKIELIDEDDKLNKFSNYFDVLNKIADELTGISLKNDPSDKLIKIIGNNFKFKKDILLIYNFDEEKFVFWRGNNVSTQTFQKMKFDLKYKNIYEEIIENKYLYITKRNDKKIFSDLLSDEDNKNSDFMLFIPFTFSGHIIGIYTVLKIFDNSQPEDDLIQALMTVGRLNGSLLYNIYQQEKLKSLNKDLSDSKAKEGPSKEEEFNYNDPLINFKTFIKNLFEKNLNKFSIIHIDFKETNGKLEFDLINFYSDIQFIVMNIVGTNSYVEISEDLNIYVILPSINKDHAEKTAKKIKEEIKNIFAEITADYKPELSSKVISCPEDSNNLVDIINLL